MYSPVPAIRTSSRCCLAGTTEPPGDIAPVIQWLESATIPMAELAEPDTGAVRARAILDRISKKQNGKLAAANTANRKRAALNNIMKYAVVERKILPASPLGPRGARMVAFFGCMY